MCNTLPVPPIMTFKKLLCQEVTSGKTYSFLFLGTLLWMDVRQQYQLPQHQLQLHLCHQHHSQVRQQVHQHLILEHHQQHHLQHQPQ